MKLYIRSAISPNAAHYDTESVTGIAYKVFLVKDGKLYPPMVANPGGVDTPVGVWLDAEEGEFAGLSKTGRPQVKQATGGDTLAYRPGWHLGDTPRAPQFDRTGDCEVIDVDPKLADHVIKSRKSLFNKCAESHVGEIYYMRPEGRCYQIVNYDAPYFPYNFIWAKCLYVMDVDYQAEAEERGYWKTRLNKQTGEYEEYRSDNYQHSYAGLNHLPTGGYYKYRTNPDPNTIPWVITGAMKVTKLLGDGEVNQILVQNGVDPIHRQGGDLTVEEILTQN